MRNTGDKVGLKVGGAGGLNHNFLAEEGALDFRRTPPEVPVPIISVEGGSYDVRLPSGYVLTISKMDITQ